MSTISCAEFERLLSDAVESRRDVAGALLPDHAASCPGCRQRWEQHGLLERALSDWRERTLHVDLVDAVIARRAFEQPSRTDASASRAELPRTLPLLGGSNSPRRQPWASVTVAALAIVVTAWTLMRTATVPGRPEGVDGPVAAKTPSTANPADPAEDELETLVSDAGNAYLVLANQTAGAFVDASRRVAPTDRLAALEWGDEESGSAPTDSWDNRLQPLGREFREALDFLFEAIPEETPSSI
jgi:hypothetical protein